MRANHFIFDRLKGSIFALFVLLLASCAKQKDFIYFQNGPINNMSADSLGGVLRMKNYIPTLQPDDIVSIHISAVDPEVVKPFNINLSSNNSGSNSSGTSTTTSSGNQGNSAGTGFLIDGNGMIDFPVLGQIKLGGLNRIEATQMLKEKLKTYINNPIVNVRILNFRVTVLGEVKTPGVYAVPHEKITLPEAIGLAGDLNIAGVRKNVLVIRDENGIKTETRVDLTSKDVFTSPVYFLNQNDLVYVEPSKARVQSSTPAVQFGALIVTSASLIINVLTLLSRK